MSFAAYQAKDFGVTSQAATNLFSRLSVEMRNRVITLSSIYNANGVPPYLTRQMEDWYRMHVHPVRGRAVEEVAKAFESLKGNRGANGFLLERLLDEIEFKTLKYIQGERQTFMQVKDAANTYEALRDKTYQYNEKRERYGREAKKWTPLLYWVVLFAWMVPEFLINWESFSKIPMLMNTPALVLGSVSLVAGSLDSPHT